MQIYVIFVTKAAAVHGLSYMECCGQIQAIATTKFRKFIKEKDFRVAFEDMVRRGFLHMRDPENESCLDFALRGYVVGPRGWESAYFYQLDRGMDHRFLNMDSLSYNNLTDYYSWKKGAKLRKKPKMANQRAAVRRKMIQDLIDGKFEDL